MAGTNKALQSTHLPQVRNQYEDYPYPLRDPEKELETLHEPYASQLDKIVYHCFGGKRDLGKGFRVLDAGGGTGDNTIYIAEQLRDIGGEVVYIDFSARSKEIAEARAAKRGLENITFIHDSLLNLPNLGLEPFDFIISAGVLHHLADPDAGLKALLSVLKPDGAMAIMVYAQNGRLAIYPLQEALRIIAPDSLPVEERLRIAKNLLATLPKRNWYHFCADWNHDIEEFGDIGIYDLLLHDQDRAYTVPQVYEWMDANALELLSFVNHFGHTLPVLNPDYYVNHPELRTRANALPLRERQAFVELVVGDVVKHTFFCAHDVRTPPVPSPETLSMVPFISTAYFTEEIYAQLAAYTSQNPGQAYGMKNISLKLSAQLPASPYAAQLWRHMDGKRSLREVFERIRRESPDTNGPDDAALLKEFSAIFTVLNAYEWMYLRDAETPHIDFTAIRNRHASSINNQA